MKRFLALALILLYLMGLAGCKSSAMPGEMPEDFSFSLTWGSYGISSYDSQTGKLIKTKHATHPEDYITKYHLPDDLKKEIYGHIRELDPYDYPDDYEPKGKETLTEKTMPLILAVRANGSEKTIRVQNIAGFYNSNNKKTQKYIAACEAIERILTASEEWNALPDYEVFYD